MRGSGYQTVGLIHARHELRGTEPDWLAMGKADLGFAAGVLNGLHRQVQGIAELLSCLGDAIVNLIVDPQGTSENIVARIKALTAYIEHVPDNFKEYLDTISAIEDPFEKGEALGMLMTDAGFAINSLKNILHKSFGNADGKGLLKFSRNKRSKLQENKVGRTTLQTGSNTLNKSTLKALR